MTLKEKSVYRYLPVDHSFIHKLTVPVPLPVFTGILFCFILIAAKHKDPYQQK